MTHSKSLLTNIIVLHRWYRDGSPAPLQAIINRGESKDHQTTSTLTITPTKNDDGAKFRCVVYNRAMKEDEKYETTVSLSVNCKYKIMTFIKLYSRYFFFLLFFKKKKKIKNE
jgi:hypothetical protein